MHRTPSLRNSCFGVGSAFSRRDASKAGPSCRRHSTATATSPSITNQRPLITTKKPVDPFTLVAPELAFVKSNLFNLLGSGQQTLTDISSYYFTLSGKQLRPLLVLLFASATNGLGSKFADRLLAPQNNPDGRLRRELDASLSSPHILNDWNPRMPDYTASFAEPFEIPSRFAQHNSMSYPNTSSDPSQSTSSASQSTPFPPNSTILPTQLRLAQISEMIHVASLLHDDVIDHASTRRSANSAPAVFGNKLTILGGDFLLGRTSSALSRLGQNEVVELMSSVVSNLIEGEVMQLRSVVDKKSHSGGIGSIIGTEAPSSSSDDQTKLNEDTKEAVGPNDRIWTTYLRKCYYKTATLMAKSCRASVVLGGAEAGHPVDEEMKDVAYAFGRNVGIAFQLVDDALDFSPSSELGKPGFGADLKLGLATAPALYAWETYPEMGPLISRRFKQPGDVEQARNLVLSTDAVPRTRELARQYSNKAIEALNRLPDTDAKEALVGLAAKIVDRAR